MIGQEHRCQKCGSVLEPRPVPGALHFPQRLECPKHGYLTPDSSSFSPEDEEAGYTEDVILKIQSLEKAKAVNEGKGVRTSGRSIPVTKSRITKEMRDQIHPPDIRAVEVSADVAEALKSNRQTPAIGFGDSIRIEHGNRTQMSRYPRDMEKILYELDADWRENQRPGATPPTEDEAKAIQKVFQMPELCLLLSEDERTACIQHKFFGLSLAEIATLTGKPKPTVQSTVARARDKLMLYLQKLLAESSNSELYLKLSAVIASKESDGIDLEIKNYVSTIRPSLDDYDSGKPDSTNPDGGGVTVRKVR